MMYNVEELSDIFGLSKIKKEVYLKFLTKIVESNKSLTEINLLHFLSEIYIEPVLLLIPFYSHNKPSWKLDTYNVYAGKNNLLYILKSYEDKRKHIYQYISITSTSFKLVTNKELTPLLFYPRIDPLTGEYTKVPYALLNKLKEKK